MMAVRIKSITGVSDFFEVGDEIVSVDTIRVEDQLDFIFNLPDQGSAELLVRKLDGREVSKKVEVAMFERTGLVLEEMEFTRCRSKCIFCFVDQMPQGLRPSLYVKDDDYRLSFLFGNFITLNDLTESNIERIIEMHLSPLYISIHAIDGEVRRRLFGRRPRRDIISVLGKLADNGIAMHAQVVLVPGINDAEILEETVRELYRFFPECRSLAVVPVGLTGHRDDLTHLDPVTPEMAHQIVQWAGEARKGFRKETGSDHFLHLADEFYLLAGESFPPSEEYDGYPQIANGVGMCRNFIDEIENDIEALNGMEHDPISIGIVTGSLGEEFIRRYISPLVLERLPWIEIVLIPVHNDLFGERVSVSGLLAGKDIIKAVQNLAVNVDCIVIPANSVNHEGRLIDDTTPDDLSRETGRKVLVPEDTFLGSDVIGHMRE